MLPTGKLTLKIIAAPSRPKLNRPAAGDATLRAAVVLGGVVGLFILPSMLPAATFLPVSQGSNAFAAPQATWNSAFTEGEAALTNQNLKLAEERFRTALSLVNKQSKNAGDREKCMLKLGATLALLDKTSEAENLYQRLLNLLVKRYGSGSKETTQVLLALGSIQESEGNHTVAMSYYQRALQISEKNYGPYSPAVAASLHRMGRASNKSGNRQAAQSHYQRAISILSRDPNQTAADQLKSVKSEYDNLLKGNDNSDSDLVNDFRQDILKDQTTAVPSPSQDNSDRANPKDGSPRDATRGLERINVPEKAQSQSLQSLQSLQSPSPQAQSQWQRQSQSRLASRRESITDENTRVALRGLVAPSSDQTLAPAYKVVTDSIFKQNRYEKGEEYYQRMIAIDIDSLGANHPSVGNDLNGLAQLYVSQGRYKDAEPLLMRALSIYDQVYGANNLLSINTRVSLASVESRLGQNDKATELYRAALSSGQSALGPNSLEIARILNDLAYLYFQQGKLEEACGLYQMAIKSTEGAVGQQDSLLAACLQDYAQVLRSLGRTSDASEAEGRAERILASSKN